MKALLSLLFTIQVIFVYAQGGPGDYDLTKNYSQGYGMVGLNASGMLESHDASGKRIPTNNQMPVAGNKMITNDFVFGVVKFFGQENKVNLMVNFSLLYNQLFFKKDSLMLAFVDPVEAFSLVIKENETNKVMNFKCGYPTTGTNTEKSFYQVMADGTKFQLLKYIYRIVQDKYSYNGPVEREYGSREKLYIYDVVNKTITEVKPTVKSISKSLPALTASIEKYAARNKIKNDDDLSGWIVSLNENTTNKK